MITIEKDFVLETGYPLERLGRQEDLLFFDIETTGFSGDYSNLYLIGCTYYKDGGWRLIQWFADTRACEAEVLENFFHFLTSFKVLVHFNGDKFDIPYLLKRCAALHLPYNFDGLTSIDIYKRVKPYRRHLGLENLKQKTIEAFLGISREDLYNGGQLIEVYEEYLRTGKQFLLNLLLLHNEDDLKGMPQLLPILHYPDFFTQEFSLLDFFKSAGNSRTIHLHLKGNNAAILPVPLKAQTPSYGLFADGDRLELSIRLYEGTLKYYYPNYKDYYYLIYEDTAVHKSIGEYVDKDARIKATKETCYTKKSGCFLPQPSPLWTPDFKNTCKDKSCFFEFCPGCFDESDKLNTYVRQILDIVFSDPAKGRPSKSRLPK